MIENIQPIYQALLGTLFTWGLTALGSGFVFFLPSAQRSILDCSLGFAGGVMTAASFWSLLAPAIELATESKHYGENGEFAFFPVSIGFLLGALFVFGADTLMIHFKVGSVYETLGSMNSLSNGSHKKMDDQPPQGRQGNILLDNYIGEIKQRNVGRKFSEEDAITNEFHKENCLSNQQWKRILLMIVAITVHNIPEGLAVGVGFGAIGKSSSATFNKAKSLTIGIGIQNFPEGMAVSLPLRAAGYSLFTSFWWGQLSGMVEPLAGVFGALAVNACQPILPYALSFAAGAMIFVVVDDIIPETQTSCHGRKASFSFIGGFITMMVLDVGLG